MNCPICNRLLGKKGWAWCQHKIDDVSVVYYRYYHSDDRYETYVVVRGSIVDELQFDRFVDLDTIIGLMMLT